MKRGTPRHPKVYDLLQALGLPIRSRPLAIGYLELLWHFTAEFAPQGDIGRYTDDRIEGALDWAGKRGKLIEALTNSKWCDKSSRHRLIVHDWDQHADDATRKKLIRSSLQFVEVGDKVTVLCPPSVPTTADNGCLPEPLPLPLPEPLPEPKRRTVTLPSTGERLIADAAQRMYDLHPKKRHLVLVLDSLTKAVAMEADPGKRLEEIEANHAAWCEEYDWKKDNGKFAPVLAEWISDRGFTKWPKGREPTKPKPVIKLEPWDPIKILAAQQKKAQQEWEEDAPIRAENAEFEAALLKRLNEKQAAR